MLERLGRWMGCLLAVGLLAGLGCGGPKAPSNPPSGPVIASFKATPPRIQSGGSTRLDWSVSDATTLIISPGVGQVTGTSREVSPTATTTYTLTATQGTQTATARVEVTVDPPPGPVIRTFKATPDVILQGGASILSWEVTGATTLSILPGSVVTGNSVEVRPTDTTKYILTASNGSQSVTAEATVTLSAPTVPSFTSHPAPQVASVGASATFSAVSKGAPAPTLQWESLAPGGTQWTPVNAGTGATTANYATPALTLGDDGRQYRVVATNSQGSATSNPAAVQVRAEAVPGSQAKGNIPALLPARLCVGLKEAPGGTWMKNSGVKWDMRYEYFTQGWRDNWGWDPTKSGQYGLNLMRTSDAMGAIPVIAYYWLNEAPPAYDESQFYNKTKNAEITKAYFSDFKVLMERCKEFGKPVMVLMEGDGFAYMQIQSGNNPEAPAAIAATGLPELQGLPDTAAGWGLAFLQIRKAVGATNVVLGMHISAWASQQDIAYFSLNLPLQPEVDKVYAFLSKLGLAENRTGDTYDVLVGDPLDRDAEYYRIKRNQDRWWDMADDAPITTKSYNRYAEWLRLWNQKSGKRWVLWQIPLGNSYSQNQPNTENNQPARAGYKDNRTEYFFGGDTSHLKKFADVGVIALLFGRGQTEQATHESDQGPDGQSYIKTHAGPLLNSGGVAIQR